jgi:hypothetical protein
MLACEGLRCCEDREHGRGLRSASESDPARWPPYRIAAVLRAHGQDGYYSSASTGERTALRQAIAGTATIVRSQRILHMRVPSLAPEFAMRVEGGSGEAAMSNKKELQNEARRAETAAANSGTPAKRRFLRAFADFYRRLSRIEPPVSDNPNSPPAGHGPADGKL